VHLFNRSDPTESQLTDALRRQDELLTALQHDLSAAEAGIKEVVGRLHADAWKAAQVRHEDAVGTQRILHADSTAAAELRHEYAVDSFNEIRQSLAMIGSTADQLRDSVVKARTDIDENSRHLGALLAMFRADTWRSHRLIYELVDDRLRRLERPATAPEEAPTDQAELPAVWTTRTGEPFAAGGGSHRRTGDGLRAFSGYDGSAARWYTTQTDWWHEHYVEAVDQVQEFLAGDGFSLEGQTALDIGCGDGIISLGMANRLKPAHLLGIDVEAVDTDFLRTQATERGVEGDPPNLTFAMSSPRQIPADDDTFDIAVSWSVFEHVEDPRALLREVRRVLKPGGLLMIQLWPFYASEHGSHLWHWFDDAFVQWRLSDEEITAHLAEACPTEALAASMLDLFHSCNRTTIDDLQKDLVAEGFYIGRVEPLTATIHLPPELQNVPLSQVAIAGVKLLAARR
jgi:ubiquinone/menaquinone biosynthesis C-methylase UbiE